MTENPFGAEQFGQGGFDMNALLQQAQQMQEQLVNAQAQLAETEVEGSAGSGAVTIKLSGAGDLQAVNIKAGSFAGDDADDLADLGDLVVAAWRDAKAKVDALAAETLGPLAGGGGLGGAGGGDSLPGLGF
ncbi:nucleoid-associated protein [Nocardioides sp. Soil797]|nr:nucleoid-associated protein [Nocardioides sp. Soil797]